MAENVFESEFGALTNFRESNIILSYHAKKTSEYSKATFVFSETPSSSAINNTVFYIVFISSNTDHDGIWIVNDVISSKWYQFGGSKISVSFLSYGISASVSDGTLSDVDVFLVTFPVSYGYNNEIYIDKIVYSNN